MKAKIALISFFCYVFSSVAFSGEHMKSLTIYEGLAGESVYKIYQSRGGIMWIATTNGVSCYNGSTITSFRAGDKRSANRVNDITQTTDGNVWVSGVNGVYKVDGTKELLEPVFTDIKVNVSSLRSHDNTIYAGTDEGIYIGSAASCAKSQRHIWLNKNHIEGSNKVNDLAFDNEDGRNLWVLCDNELYRYDTHTGNVACLNLRGKLNLSNTMRTMVVTKGRIFIGTFNDGVLEYNLQKKELQRYIDVGCPVITCLSADSKHLYIGTDGLGLQVIDMQKDSIVDTYSTSSESRFQLKDNTVYAYYHDDSGVNFFGYFRQGLDHNYYCKPLFHAYTYRSFDSRDINVRSFCIDDKVKVLGSRSGLYYIDEQKDLVKFFSPEELGGSIVTNIKKYANMYYVCTFNGGVMRINPETMTISRFGTNDALRTSSFSSLEISPNNELWMAGNAGVFVYNATTDTERHYDSSNSQLPNTYFYNLLFDRLGRCWISSQKGIFIYDPTDGKIHTNGFPEGFFNKQQETTGIQGDGYNLLFFGLDGLFHTNEELTTFNSEAINPTQNEYIAQAIYDKQHHKYWFATEKGLFRLSEDLKNIHKFSSETGLGSKAFSNGATFIDPQGTLWTGTMNGLFYANLEEAEKFSVGNTQILLDRILVRNEPRKDESIVSSLRENKIHIGYHWGADEVSFLPVLLNYCNQEGLCFEYRIGTNGNWQLQKNLEQIHLQHLAWGKNILQIRLAGQEEYTEYTLYATPTVWFILEWVTIFVVIAILILFYRQHRSVIREREERARLQKALEEEKQKYSRVQVSDDEQRRLYQKLDEYMRMHQPYLNTDLKLSDLAASLDVSTAKLSQHLNVFVQRNYYDFVNKYRLDEFKRRLQSPQYRHYTLLALAEECGFKRSSFFATFKKEEGMTPTEYAKKMHIETK